MFSDDQKQMVSTQPITDVPLERAISDYLHEHEIDNHSDKTLEWHRTALGLLQMYLEHERKITLVREIDASDITAWFTSLRKTPGARGKTRSEHTIQTYARSARAFFHRQVLQGILQANPFDRVVLPNIGVPPIQTITNEEFEQLLLACTPPPHNEGPLPERAAARNRAILWLFYDTGIRVSELTNLRLKDFDRKGGVITVKGKGLKERGIPLGQNCLDHILSYLGHLYSNEGEPIQWKTLEDKHLFLSEKGKPLTKNGITLLFARLKKRAGITGKRISPHIFRHTFAIRYLKRRKDLFGLQKLLGYEDMTMVKHYMQMSEQTIRKQEKADTLDDHLPRSLPELPVTRRRGFRVKEQPGENL